MKPQDPYSNMYKKSELETPYFDNRQAQEQAQMSNQEYAAPFKVSMSYGTGKKKQKPSRMPNLSYSKEKSESKRPSVISIPEAINVVALLKKELKKINCNLKNYFIRTHIRGIDIEKITVFCSDVRNLRKTVKKMDTNKVLEHDRMQKTTSLALIAISKKFKKKLKNELRLEAQLFDFEDSDYGIISVTVPIKKKEKEPEPSTPEMPSFETPTETPEISVEPEEGASAASPEGTDLMPLEIEGEPAGEQPIAEETPEEEQAIPETGAEEKELPEEVNPEEEVGKSTQLPELI